MAKEEQAPDVEAANAAAVAPKKKFPTPKFVINIYSRRVVVVDKEEADNSGVVETAWMAHIIKKTGLVIATNAATATSSGSAAAAAEVGSKTTTSSTKKKKLRVKMQSLLVKMINRLIREDVIPSEAVSIVGGSQFVSIRILVAPSAVPIIMLRCERIGVGNVTGTVHVCPLETSLVPAASNKQEIDMFLISSSPSTSTSVAMGQDQKQSTATAKSTAAVGASAGGKTVETLLSVEEEEGGYGVDDADSVSSSDDMDDVEGESVPSVISIPFLSPEKKKRLQEKIVKARKEWRDTSSRVRVMQVVEEVTAGASFTFDYALFVLCAAFIAGVGLATDSSATVIASMLVSPIMGPVMGMTFGTTVRSQTLVFKGFRNEMVSLLMCFLVGIIVCIIAVGCGTPAARNWPTAEMEARGDAAGLLSGIFVAIPSGMAVALSTLGKNSSGMVGVAISLSLLPPAVNASMCWMYELLLLSKSFDRNEGDTSDYVYMGGVSFSLTLVNIMCIWIAGTFTFWLKEVVPLKEANAFWKKDIQEFRDHRDERANITVINDGIEACLELQNDQPNLYHEDFDLSGRRVAVERRQGLANNALEDAFYLDNAGLKTKRIVPGGAIDLDEDKLQEAATDTAMAEDLLNNANKFGCLEDAGKALFDKDLLAKTSITDDNVFVKTDIGIHHGSVAGELLLHEL